MNRYLKIAPLCGLVLLLGCTAQLSAQSPSNRQIRSINELFAAYEQAKGIEYVSLSPSLLSWAVQDPKNSSNEVLKSLSSLYIINLDITPESSSLAKQIRTDVQSLVQQNNFEEMMKIRDDGSTFVIYLSKNKDKKTNNTIAEALLLVADEKSELVLIGLTGSITQDVINAVLDGKIGVEIKPSTKPKTNK